MPENHNIEIRSPQIEDILGKQPNWIIRAGIGVISTIILLIFTSSFIIKYPDVVTAPVVILSENIPAEISAKASGKICQLMVLDKQKVVENEILAVIENTANYKHVIALDSTVSLFKKDILLDNINIADADSNFSDTLSVGDLQPDYIALKKMIKEMRDYLSKDYVHQKIKNIQVLLVQHQRILGKSKTQSSIAKEQLYLSKKQFARDSILLKNEVIPAADFEKSKNAYLQVFSQYQSATMQEVNTSLTITQLEQSIIELNQQFDQDIKSYKLNMSGLTDNLQSKIKLWRMIYLVTSPINGVVNFTKFWSVNQNVIAGDKIMAVVPQNKVRVRGRVILPMRGSGKVAIGQKVNIKLENFPHIEFGMLQGRVSSISEVTNENNYYLEITLNQGLTSNYGKKLAYRQELSGSADIITDDILLIERFFSPIRSLYKKARE